MDWYWSTVYSDSRESGLLSAWVVSVFFLLSLESPLRDYRPVSTLESKDKILLGCTTGRLWKIFLWLTRSSWVSMDVNSLVTESCCVWQCFLSLRSLISNVWKSLPIWVTCLLSYENDPSTLEVSPIPSGSGGMFLAYLKTSSLTDTNYLLNECVYCGKKKW